MTSTQEQRNGPLLFSWTSTSRMPRNPGGGGGGDSYMEQTGMLVGNFEFNP